MIILDTDVLSAIMRPELNPLPIAWLDRTRHDEIWTTAINVLESRSGLLLLPDGKRKSDLLARLDIVLSNVVYGRVLPFDQGAAEAAAVVAATRISVGTNKGTRDTQIAGIALAQRATLATRNTKDFADLDISLVDPWAALPPT